MTPELGVFWNDVVVGQMEGRHSFLRRSFCYGVVILGGLEISCL